MSLPSSPESDVTRRLKFALAACLFATMLLAEAKQPRSAAAVAEFKRQHHCPSTGKPRGPCPGYVVDHVTPLCAGGADRPANMQWQTKQEAKHKDREERRLCRHARAE